MTANIGSGDDFGCSVVIQSDGKVIVAGRTMNGAKGNFALVRYEGTEKLGVGQNEEQRSLSVYPNPTKGFLNIQNESNITIDKIGIYDLTGKKVLEQYQNTNHVDVHNLAKVTYVLEIFVGKKNETRRFIKD